MNKKYYTNEWAIKIKEACENAQSMAQACASLQMNHNTFIRHAKRLNVYKPNPAGKGIHKKSGQTIPLLDIIDKGLHPQYKSSDLRLRLIREGIKEHACESCKRKT